MASKLLRLSKNFTAISQRLKHSHTADYQAAIASAAPVELTVANNNLKIATQTTDSDTTTVGLYIDAGSRYEDAKTNGAGNLLQRMLFKGTTKRAQADLVAELANLGTRLHACISRERSAIYATCLNKDVSKVVEIIADLVQNPKLNAEDLDQVRKDILRETTEIEANIQDVVFDYLHATAFQGTPLGQTALGSHENITSLTTSDLKYYLDTHYKASRIVLAASGGTKHSELSQLAGQHLSKLDNTFDGEVPVLAKCRYTGSEVRLRDDSLPFAYIAMAVEGPAWNSPDYIPLLVGTSAIGAYDRSLGHGNDKLSPYHMCHNARAFNITYSDTGLFGVYSVCEPMQCEDVSAATMDAWHRLSYSITDAELDIARNRLINQLLTELTTTKGSCQHIGNSVLSLGRVLSLADLEGTISKLSNDTIRNVTDKYTNNKCLVVSAVGPVESLPDYVNLRTRMYWARV